MGEGQERTYSGLLLFEFVAVHLRRLLHIDPGPETIRLVGG